MGVAPKLTEYLTGRAAAMPVRARVTNATNTIVGSNGLAVQAARAALEGLGFTWADIRTVVEGEARARGEEFAARLLEVQAQTAGDGRPRVIIWGGETTVTVGDGKGFGGRNQEAGLAAAIRVSGRRGLSAMFFATDGIDGACPPGHQPNAGAIVTGDSAPAARRAGLDAQAMLDAHDSYRFAEGAGAAMRGGPSGTNVNDVWVGFAY